MKLNRTQILLATLGVALCLLPACASTWSPQRDADAKKQGYDNADVAEAIAAFKSKNAGLAIYFKEAHGFAVFPSVGKGAFAVGAAHGNGTVFQGGKVIGTASLTQITFGFQFGGQSFRELIFFRDAAALKRFKDSRMELGAQASAVAPTAGATTEANYENGVAIFTMSKGGLMVEASVGGQTFEFKPRK